MSEQSPWICIVFWCGSGPFCVVLLFSLLAKRKSAGRFACRRCCRVSFCSVGFSMVCLICEAKGFILFAHFSTASLRALERYRPQQRKKSEHCPWIPFFGIIRLNWTIQTRLAWPCAFCFVSCSVLFGLCVFGLLLLCCFCLFCVGWMSSHGESSMDYVSILIQFLFWCTLSTRWCCHCINSLNL